MKTLTLYTKPGCTYCAQAKDHLKKLDIAYEEIDISQDEAKRNWVLSQGHKTLPVLYVGEKLLVPGGFNGLKTMRKEEIIERLNDAG